MVKRRYNVKPIFIQEIECLGQLYQGLVDSHILNLRGHLSKCHAENEPIARAYESLLIGGRPQLLGDLETVPIDTVLDLLIVLLYAFEA